SLIHYHIRNSGYLQGAFFLDNHFYCYGDTSLSGIPTMFVKLDTAGNTVWSADNRNQLPSSPPTSEQTRQFPYFNSVIAGSDSNFYAIQLDFPTSDYRGFLAKVDGRKGGTMWMKKLGENAHPRPSYTVYDYSDSMVLAGINDSSHKKGFLLEKFRKSNGDFVDSVTLPLNSVARAFGNDHLKMLCINQSLVLVANDTCYKYASFENPVLVWKTAVGSMGGEVGKLVLNGT